MVFLSAIFIFTHGKVISANIISTCLCCIFVIRVLLLKIVNNEPIASFSCYY